MKDGETKGKLMLPYQKLPQAPKSIAVFRALMLGDLLCTVPAFRALRHAYPQSRITLVGLPWAKAFAQRFSHIFDEFLLFPGYPGLPEITPDIYNVGYFFIQAQQKNFDLAIQMHGSGSYVNSICVLLGAKYNAGFYVEGEYCPDPQLFIPYPDSSNEVIRYIQLIESLGIPSRGTHLEFPLFKSDFDRLQAIDGADQLKEDYVCIHPGARLLSRRWLPDRFAKVGDDLAAAGFKIVLTGGKDEETLVASVSSIMKAPHINMANKTDLGSLGALLKGARLLVCNDTGVSHMAAALKVPSVVIVTGSDFERWRPMNDQLHKILYSPINCRPCFYHVCPIGQPCAQQVETKSVTDMALNILKEPLGVSK
jgi:ADP-heptose:LPS heptosyltransferase